VSRLKKGGGGNENREWKIHMLTKMVTKMTISENDLEK
jgi:hypothetical protein